MDQYMNDLINELKMTFENMNSTYMFYIEKFHSAIDDRDKYKADIDRYTLRKENIISIGECIGKFMDTWNNIIHDFIEDKATVKAPALV